MERRLVLEIQERFSERLGLAMVSCVRTLAYAWIIAEVLRRIG